MINAFSAAQVASFNQHTASSASWSIYKYLETSHKLLQLKAKKQVTSKEGKSLLTPKV